MLAFHQLIWWGKYMKKLFLLMAFMGSFAVVAGDTTKSKFKGYVSTWDGNARIAQNVYLDLSGLHKNLNYERLEDYSGNYKFELRNDFIILILKKENKAIVFGQIDDSTIDVNINDRIPVESISTLKTKLIRFKMGIPVPRWMFDCGITGCGLEFDWKRARKLLLEIETDNGSMLCLAKGFKNKPELASGKCL